MLRIQNLSRGQKINIESYSYPGIPPDSSLLAMVTSLDHTSNCHFLSPRTPQRTEPEWTPIRIESSTDDLFLFTKLIAFIKNHLNQSPTDKTTIYVSGAAMRNLTQLSHYPITVSTIQ